MSGIATRNRAGIFSWWWKRCGEYGERKRSAKHVSFGSELLVSVSNTFEKCMFIQSSVELVNREMHDFVLLVVEWRSFVIYIH